MIPQHMLKCRQEAGLIDITVERIWTLGDKLIQKEEVTHSVSDGHIQLQSGVGVTFSCVLCRYFYNTTNKEGGLDRNTGCLRSCDCVFAAYPQVIIVFEGLAVADLCLLASAEEPVACLTEETRLGDQQIQPCGRTQSERSEAHQLSDHTNHLVTDHDEHTYQLDCWG